jgi:peptidoglycan/LPS O-acetylase OafA/YrhL
MRYRREVDGLRAVAVLPVILFHAGFAPFRGGFVGVDVFFVISGYLITSIILGDLTSGKFSLANFYQRRARRILPALFLVMAVTTVFACMWMMPDELKNYGQSLVATALFSNNILLTITSGYWDLASLFKPLLHTWSVGVEEQYYILFPLFMLVAWRYARRYLVAILTFLLLLSLAAAAWGVRHAPIATFYLLPTRAWEILLGALIGYYLARARPVRLPLQSQVNQALSLLGLSAILASVYVFSEGYPTPGLMTLLPTGGAALIILFATEGTLVHRVLGSRVLVGIGLISYSLYLWHQPLFALARVYAAEPPGPHVYLALIGATFVLSYFTWRFVEAPFRNGAIIPTRVVVSLSALGVSTAVGFGIFLNATYGMWWRAFDSEARIEYMDKRIYNERIYQLSKEKFATDKLKVLIIGNSFGRDVVNMTLETFGEDDIEIVYREDFADCILPYKGPLREELFGSADIIVFSSGFHYNCAEADAAFAKDRNKLVFYIGSKYFGDNLNWVIRFPQEARRNLYNVLPAKVVALDEAMASRLPKAGFVSLLAPVLKDGRVPITDNDGRMLSTDRSHVTKFGAIYFGERALLPSPYGTALRARSGTTPGINPD